MRVQLIILLLLHSSCVSDLPFVATNSGEKKSTLPQSLIEGDVVNQRSETISLDSLTTPLVLMISSENCSTCLKEAQLLRDLFAKQGKLPTNVYFFTLVLGGFIEDAEAFATFAGITWDYGIDTANDYLFKTYCTGVTPCVLTVNNTTQKITRFVGSSSISDWEKETGLWVY